MGAGICKDQCSRDGSAKAPRPFEDIRFIGFPCIPLSKESHTAHAPWMRSVSFFLRQIKYSKCAKNGTNRIC